MTLTLSESQRKAIISLAAAFGDRRCILIGATALASQISLKRDTKDIDLAVVVQTQDLKGLLGGAAWRADPRLPHRWYSTEDAVADIIPATPDLITNGEVKFDGDAVRMSLVGFDLVLEHTNLVDVPGTTLKLEVATWPVILVLKMVAWLDRPAERTRDLGDIAAILEQALPEFDDRRWDTSHPVGSKDLDHEDQSPFFAGLELSRIVTPRPRSKVDEFLTAVSNPALPPFAQMVAEARYVGADPESILVRRLGSFRRGLDHK